MPQGDIRLRQAPTEAATTERQGNRTALFSFMAADFPIRSSGASALVMDRLAGQMFLQAR
jgi:hypothetical protein